MARRAESWRWPNFSPVALIGAILLFLLNLRRAGETTVRAAERLQNMKRTNDALRRMLEVGGIGLAVAMTWLSAGATGSFDHAAYPPAVDYPTAVQERTAAEIEALPEDCAVVGMMADYPVLRRQARACG